MPKALSRFAFCVKSVRAGRVRGISFGDCLRSGVLRFSDDHPSRWTPERGHPATNEMDLADDLDQEVHALFADAWNARHAKQGFGWEADPWCWFYELEEDDESQDPTGK